MRSSLLPLSRRQCPSAVLLRPICLLAGLLLFLTTIARAESRVPITNPGFEEGLVGWSVGEADNVTAEVLADAAREGTKGLWVKDSSDTMDVAKVTSDPIPVGWGKRYRLTFWARTLTPHVAGVFVRFLKPDGKMFGEEHRPYQSVNRGEGEWIEYVIEITAPEGASSAVLLVASYSKMKGEVAFDDFALEEITTAAGAAGAAAAFTPGPVKTQGRNGPAKMIIKADDLRLYKGGIHPRWQKFIDLVKERKIKASIGIICDSLEGDNEGYFQRIKDVYATGLFEFWNHGYDHREWKEGDKRVFEFMGSSYEHQKKHFTRSNQLAREKLGFPFRTFAPPFNVADENTAKVLAEDTDIKVWIFGDKNRPSGKIILERLWDVTIENPNFTPNLEKLKAGYESHPERDYFVIQCHPATWDEGRFAEFVRIVDYLVAEGVVFVNPAEYCGVEIADAR